nr:hypothetical protein [Tanacetum cinerariifolium]
MKSSKLQQINWTGLNPKGQQYPHDLLKPLPLIPNNRGHRVIPFEHFIKNELEYLRGGASSREYTTSITKTKAADYGHIKWIEDLVPRTMWIEEPIGYDKHALWKSDKDRAVAMIQAINKRLKKGGSAVCWRKAVRGRLQDATEDNMIYRMLLLSFKRVMSTSTHPIIILSDSDVEDAFSSINSPDYIPTSPYYSPASPRNTASDSETESDPSEDPFEDHSAPLLSYLSTMTRI